MSLSSTFEDEINNYANQLSAYKDQMNDYKNQLLEAKGEASNFTKSLVTEIGIPIGTEIVRAGATKVLGSSAGDLVTKLAGTGLKTAQGGGNLMENLADTARQAMSGVEPAAEAEATGGATSALNTARQGVMSVFNRIRAGGQDAVSGAEDAIAGAQENLSNVASNVASQVGDRLTSNAGDLIQSQVSRLSSLADQNGVTSILKSAGGAIRQAPEDSSVFGDVELSNMAAAVPRAGVPDLSLPFESTYQGITEPLAQSGLTSNNIARAFLGGKQELANVEVPDSLVPTQEEALEMLTSQVRPLITSDLLPQGAGDIAGGFLGRLSSGVPDIAGLAKAGTSALEDVAGSATGALESVTGAATGALEGAAGAATGAVEGATSTLASAAAEAGVDVAAGAEGGPVGLVIGGAIGLATFLYDMFHHREGPSIAPPPAMPMASVPSFQPGLATSN